MFSGVEDHVIGALANATVRESPYAHIYVERIFPQDFYAALRRNWPNARHLISLGTTGRVPQGAYNERFIMPLTQETVQQLPPERQDFWREVAGWMLQARLLQAMLEKFETLARKRFASQLEHTTFVPEVLVVRDHTNYKLGPHTDAPRKVLSALFYCPDDDSMSHLGTSLYTPAEAGFTCPGGPHYPFENFRKVATMEFRPNTLFAFFKSDTSFHGVDPIRDADVLRDLMLYDIRVAAA